MYQLRRATLAVLRRFNPGDVHIRHHYTGDRLLLHSYKHKGYWYYGRKREAHTMRVFAAILKPGDTVIEVGGHIGYISLFFSWLVGETGRVLVFEPGPNNLPYTRENTRAKSNITLVPVALSDSEGTVDFYVEELTGQNNTLVVDYDVFDKNRANAGAHDAYRTVRVQTERLDDYLSKSAPQLLDTGIALLKIDVEGAESLVLSGASRLLAESRPVLMVEVTHNHAAVQELLVDAGYTPYTPDLEPVEGQVKSNSFWFHTVKHADLLARLLLERPQEREVAKPS